MIVGVYNLTGIDSLFHRLRKMAIGLGSFNVTGKDIILHYSRILLSGIFVLTGTLFNRLIISVNFIFV